MSTIINGDLEEFLETMADEMRALKGARIFVTGGTGFVGSWLLETFVHANKRLALNARTLVLTRDRDGFTTAKPHLANAEGVSLISGDVRNLPQDLGTFDGFVHAATPASASINALEPFLMLDTIISGGRSVLELAMRCGPVPFLFTSSGAVYGPQPSTLKNLDEGYMGAPDPMSSRSAYHEGKRLGELQCALASHTHGIQAKIARLFAFVGPYLPLNRHFAIGNFISDGLNNRPIVVQGEGTTVRSYQYASDMAAWLWMVYARGVTLRPYNIGSDQAIPMRDLANAVSRIFEPRPDVVVMQESKPNAFVDRYVPSTARVRSELGARTGVPLDEAIRRTVRHHRETQ